MSSDVLKLDNNKLDDIAGALQQLATLLTTEAERQEVYGLTGAFDLFEKAGEIWGLAEEVLACKRYPPKSTLPFKKRSTD